jgi:hypothetical protein
MDRTVLVCRAVCVFDRRRVLPGRFLICVVFGRLFFLLFHELRNRYLFLFEVVFFLQQILEFGKLVYDIVEGLAQNKEKNEYTEERAGGDEIVDDHEGT